MLFTSNSVCILLFFDFDDGRTIDHGGEPSVGSEFLRATDCACFCHVVGVIFIRDFAALANKMSFLASLFLAGTDSDSSGSIVHSQPRRHRTSATSSTPPPPSDNLLQEELLNSDLDEEGCS